MLNYRMIVLFAKTLSFKTHALIEIALKNFCEFETLFRKLRCYLMKYTFEKISKYFNVFYGIFFEKRNINDLRVCCTSFIINEIVLNIVNIFCEHFNALVSLSLSICTSLKINLSRRYFASTTST